MKPLSEQIKAAFSYNPITGVLTRLPSRDLTGRSTQTQFQGVNYSKTHIIWVVHYGIWPPTGKLKLLRLIERPQIKLKENLHYIIQ